jgi:hypothetical protein
MIGNKHVTMPVKAGVWLCLFGLGVAWCHAAGPMAEVDLGDGRILVPCFD